MPRQEQRQQAEGSNELLVEGSMYVERNICDITFDKANVCNGTVNRMNDYVETVVHKGSRKKMFWEISQNSQES